MENYDFIAEFEQKYAILDKRLLYLGCKKYFDSTFEKDDLKNAEITSRCRGYADSWPQMEKNNVGIIFLGEVGTGKTFYACCIANALIAQNVEARIITLSKIIEEKEERKKYINNILNCDLLIIDDFGSERQTDYCFEKTFNIIDNRYKSQKPLIITTNLTPFDLTNPSNLAKKRIYDRVLEMCQIHIPIRGTSRRGVNK